MLLQATLVAYLVLTLAAFLAYGWDKWRAKRSARRVPERTLHGLALLGGFVGAWLGMRVFRHKTQKPVFAVVLFLAAALHAVAWGLWYYRSELG